MTTKLKLKPGQRGTKKLVERFGKDLVAVRYRYDSENRVRIKTAEIIVEKKPWTPPLPVFTDSDLVPVQIGFSESDLRQMAKDARGRWDPNERLWYIPFGKIKGTELEKHIILDAFSKSAKTKSI